MKSAACLIASGEDRVNACFVFSGLERRSLEAESVQFIRSTPCGQHVRARKISCRRAYELPVNVKLYFDTARWQRFVKSPTVNMLRRGFIERAAKERVEGCQVECDGEHRDEQRLED